MRWWPRRRPPLECCPACDHPWIEHAGSDPAELTSPDGDECGECRYEIDHGLQDDPEQLCRLRAYHSRIQAVLAAIYLQLAEVGPVSWSPPTPQWRTARVEYHLDGGRPVSLWEDNDTLKAVVDHRVEFLVDDADERRFVDDARAAVSRLLTPSRRQRP